MTRVTERLDRMPLVQDISHTMIKSHNFSDHKKSATQGLHFTIV